MAAPGRERALDHVVVVMFENRSFDHLLGRLYEPGEVASFEGVIGKDLGNPIPAWAEHGAERGVVPYGVAKDMNTPYPDPGEEYPQINTQLYGHIDPPSNRGAATEQMIAPYNPRSAEGTPRAKTARASRASRAAGRGMGCIARASASAAGGARARHERAPSQAAR